jgi:5-methylcytosine-specific restriction endonuclease McrA
MTYDDDTLNRIYDRTDGRCHICVAKLSFRNYGAYERRAAWEVEHSRARSTGGTGHLNNLYPACIYCNRAKGTVSARTARRWYGRTRAPLSRDRKHDLRESNTLAGVFWGGLLGAFGGPRAMIAGACIGGIIGASAAALDQ